MNTPPTAPAAPAAQHRRPHTLAVHSIDQVVFTVPDLQVAEDFYTAFGLAPQRQGDRLLLRCHGSPHTWATLVAAPGPKRLVACRYGVDAADLPAFAERIASLGLACPPPALAVAAGAVEGLWLRDPDGTPLQLVAAPKVSPSQPCPVDLPAPVRPGQGAAPSRSRVAPVRPSALSHLLFFTADVPRMVGFGREVLGLRLSDAVEDGIAFLHTPHGSDHHLVAFAKSHGPGLHHSSWVVGSVDAVGLGAEQMRRAGHTRGWGLGRHVLGSNHFHYVQDPWGSFAEYSHGIDFIPHDLDWPAAHHPPEDALYVWGPAVPEDFVTNHQAVG